MKTSDNQQPSEHAMRAANILYDATATQWAPESVAPTIDRYAIAPAVAEANKLAEARIDARDKQWSDLWAALNAQGIEAVVDGKLVYEAGKDPVAERDKRIAELVEVLDKMMFWANKSTIHGISTEQAFALRECHDQVRTLLAKHRGQP